MTINATSYIAFDIAKIIAAEYKAGTELSERKMAEKHNVPRSRIQKIKKEVAAGEWDEILAPKVEAPAHNVKQTSVKLENKTHQKAPTKKAKAIYDSVNGDFDQFTLTLLEQNPKMTKAYINGQYHRCQNAQ
ncbi:hypothetical protein AVV44_gp054 [Cronobacter phage S13]|jgi:hypothetical protein|uniref:Uncharacterized protein n=1 Tax=Cronobacter phage LPCS28 TaxID=2924885 RepID=A0AAE9G9N0_9CAUD|nr:hypothetical protein AVV44_gp054 [Cronobacter phage S13]YP_010665905.1 hypothetical protein PQB73_gp119 [Cronobacter phage LPCS28]AIA64853.1 hypothetical protein S13_054 [Cronobacter phage S13]UNY47094.1 hypothetical protein EHEKIMEA_00212 [Cronobacter phage LPCS28]